MKKSIAIVALGLLAAGCAVTATEKGPEPTTPVEQTPTESAKKGNSEAPIVLPTTAPNVDANLARLRDLKIFTVGELIVTAPQTGNCYGPCPEEIEKAKLDAAQKLQTFTDSVVAEAAKAPATGVTSTDSDANLEVLRGLKVVDVGDLIVEQPKNNPNCYNFPCNEDIEAAKAINDARAGQLANIAKAF